MDNKNYHQEITIPSRGDDLPTERTLNYLFCVLRRDKAKYRFKRIRPN